MAPFLCGLLGCPLTPHSLARTSGARAPVNISPVAGPPSLLEPQLPGRQPAWPFTASAFDATVPATERGALLGARSTATGHPLGISGTGGLQGGYRGVVRMVARFLREVV